MMIYCDIHTHQVSQIPDDIFIMNTGIELPVEQEGKDNWLSLGLHPWYIVNAQEQLDQLKQNVLDARVVAIGEAGIDKLINIPLSVQKDVFLAQAYLAETVEKPLIIHCVKAWQELLAAKKEINPRMPWIIHGFRGNEKLTDQLISQGFYLSFGLYFNPKSLLVAWPKHIFIETDDKKISIRDVYTHIAVSLSVPLERLTSQLRDNVRHIFSI